jgi:hypothetical protein
MSVDTSAGTIVWAAPDWEDVHQWVSLLGASMPRVSARGGRS